MSRVQKSDHPEPTNFDDTEAEAMPLVALAGIPVALHPRIRKCELAHFL